METIILVPGGGGSKLELKKHEIWPPTLAEVTSNYQRITELQDPGVKATKIIDVFPPLPCYEVYKPLQDDLDIIANSFTPAANRIDFAYDWRKDIAWSADQLASEIEACVNAGSTSVTLVAHSMGNLLVRLILEGGDYSSKGWFDKITRYVAICGPHFGVPYILECALGLKSWMSISPTDVRTLSENPDYPGGYQCLPFEGSPVLLDIQQGPLDFYNSTVAARFGLNQQNLDAAKDLQNKLNFMRQPPGVKYILVAGSNLQTDETIEYDGSSYVGTTKDDLGDSSIPLASAAPAQRNCLVTPGDHIGIFKSYPFRQILYDALTTGALIPQFSLLDELGVTLNVNNLIFSADEPIEFLIIPDLRTADISGTLQIMRVADMEGKKFVRYREHQLEYRGPAIRFIRSTIPAPADPGAYRMSFTGTHRTSARTAAGFIVSRAPAGRPSSNKRR